MRIIAGEFRGRRLKTPSDYSIRPTSDKVKEAVFSIIMPYLSEKTVMMDVFSGTGNLGLEALSRGARRATLVDKSGQAAGIIKRNIEKVRLDGSDEIRFYKMNVSQALELLGKEGVKFDIIFMDPPYKDVPLRLEEETRLISENRLLADGGMLIAEHDRDYEPPEELNGLKRVRSCSYGITVITFFKE